MEKFRRYIIETDKDKRQKHRLLAHVTRAVDNLEGAIQFYDTNKDESDPEDAGEEIEHRVTQGICMKCGKGTVDLYPIAVVWTAYIPFVVADVKRETKLCKECLAYEDKRFYRYTENYKRDKEKQ